MTQDKLNQLVRQRMDRSDQHVKSEHIYQVGLDFIQSPASLLEFHTNCRAMAFHAMQHCAPPEAQHLGELYAEASFQAICFSIVYEKHKKDHHE
jgi:hypothetical protein